MSYFPPPPPAPPPSQIYSTPDFAPRPGGFRGRTNGGYRARGAHLRGGHHRSSKEGYSKGFNGSAEYFGTSNEASREAINQYGHAQQNAQDYMLLPASGQAQLGITPPPVNWNAAPTTPNSTLASQMPLAHPRFDLQRGGNHPVYQPHKSAQHPAQSSQYRSSSGLNGMSGPSQHFHSSRPSLPSSRGRGQKRGYNEAFGHRERARDLSSGHASPAVPSFGDSLPLPAKPPAPVCEMTRPRQGKRKNNKLGLTPAADGRGFSDRSEDDEDEESRLLTNVENVSEKSQCLQINYRGRKSTLQSAADIAAWIKERKSKFPTRAKAAEAAERKRQQEEQRRAAKKGLVESRQKALKEERERRMQKAEESKRRRVQSEEDRNVQKEHQGSEEAALKTKLKIEKLRRKLEKEEKRAAKAEAKSSVAEDGKNPKDDSMPDMIAEDNKRNLTMSFTESQPLRHTVASDGDPVPTHDLQVELSPPIMTVAPNCLTPTLQSPDHSESLGILENRHMPSFSGRKMPPYPRGGPDTASTAPRANSQKQASDKDEHLDASPDTLSSNLSTSSSSTLAGEETSSSGSDSTSSSDLEPEETTTRRDRPERVPPPVRATTKKSICKFYLKDGRCHSGRACRFKHELPERGSKRRQDAKPAPIQPVRTERISLYQRLVMQEKRNEEEKAIREAKARGSGEGVVERAIDRDGTSGAKGHA